MDPIKAGLDMSTGRWKSLLAAFSLFAALVIGVELYHGLPAIERGYEGRLGIATEELRQSGRRFEVIRKIEPWSRIGEFGAEVGDLIVADRWYDLGRSQQVGEVIGLTLSKGGQSRHILAPTVARPIKPLDKVFYLLNAVLCTTGILFGLAVGFRQPDRLASRALALAFVCWSINVYPAFTPPVVPHVIGRFVFEVALLPGWYLALWFAVHYPDQAPTGWRALLRRVMPVYLLACVVCIGLSAARGLGQFARESVFSYTAFVGVTGLSMLVSFWDGWRRSEGVLSQRFAWLLGSFSLFFLSSYVTYIADLTQWEFRFETMFVSVLGSLLMYVGLAYAVLRHRVLDFGLAINRSLVFALVGAVLLGSFQVLQFIVGRFLHFEDPTKAGLLSAVLAATVLLAFPRVKPWADKLVDHVFFAAWVSREEALRRFVETAAHFTQVQALSAAFVAEVDRFTGMAGCAIYLRTGASGFERIGSTIREAPAHADDNEPVIVALRAGRKAVRCDEAHSELPGDLAVPLGSRDGHAGCLLLGRKPSGDHLRADEVEALSHAALRVGANLQALTIVSLSRELVALQQKMGVLEEEVTEFRRHAAPSAQERS